MQLSASYGHTAQPRHQPYSPRRGAEMKYNICPHLVIMVGLIWTEKYLEHFYDRIGAPTANRLLKYPVKVRELGLAPRRKFHRWPKVRDLGLAPRRRPKVPGLGLAPRRRPKVPSLGLAPCRQPPLCRPRSGRSNVEVADTPRRHPPDLIIVCLTTCDTCDVKLGHKILENWENGFPSS